MRGFRSATWPRVAILGAIAIALAGCSDVDDALFGPVPANQTAQAGGTDNSSQQASTDNSAPPAAAPTQPADTSTLPPAPAQTAEASPPPAETPPPSESEAPPPPDNTQMASETPEEPEAASSELPGTLPPETPPSSSNSYGSPVGSALGSTIAAVPIDSGRDTGTSVSKTIAGLRNQIASLDSKLVDSGHRLSGLRQAGQGATAHYQDARAKIMTHLQMGTTRGNPELVNQWNDAQSALDQLAANLNAMGSLGVEVANDANSVRQSLMQITSTYDVPGALDEDHRQLTVLEDETRQLVVAYDRLRKDVGADVPRQTNFVANERANLAQLAAAIKRGELYSWNGNGASYAGMPMSVASADPTRPLVVIKFDHPDVSYQQILLAALKQALRSRPSANFKVVAVAPTRGSEDDVVKAQSTAERHAQDVLRSITDMGVPATRLQVASATDPKASVSEVQVFVI